MALVLNLVFKKSTLLNGQTYSGGGGGGKLQILFNVFCFQLLIDFYFFLSLDDFICLFGYLHGMENAQF